MREQCQKLLSKIQSLRKNSETTAAELIQEYNNCMDIYEELAGYFEESINAFILNKWDILFHSVLTSFDFEPTRLDTKERRNLTLGMYFMKIFEVEIKQAERLHVPYELEINDYDDLDWFTQNRLDDISYIMEGILSSKGKDNVKDLIDDYTYFGIKKEASIYFGFDDNIKELKK